MMEMASGSAVATIKLEYSQDGGFRWFQARAQDDSLIQNSGAITSTELLGWLTNETPKNTLYRWNCTSWTSGTIPVYLTNMKKPTAVLSHVDSVYVFANKAAPLSGVDGFGAQLAGPGSMYVDTSTGKTYRNEGNSRLPMWVSF
jgi:hypothetical protein